MHFIKPLLAGAFALTTATLGATPAGATDPAYHLAEAGVLSVAITGDMPASWHETVNLPATTATSCRLPPKSLGSPSSRCRWSGRGDRSRADRPRRYHRRKRCLRRNSADTLSMTDPTGYFQNGITSRKEADGICLKTWRTERSVL